MPDSEEIIRQTKDYAKKTMSGDSSHDWWHVYRVWKISKKIAKRENADLFIVQLAALLHDIADWKFHGGDEDIGPTLAKDWMKKIGVDERTISHVCEIIRDISFKGAGVRTKMRTLEGRVVQDADRLDASGAIGIARTFAYGGHKGRELYNPGIKPEKHRTAEEYKSGKGPTINHFYEKLLLLKDRMNTPAGKRMAAQRHNFMKKFLEQFFEEWNE